jgi:hypothetical protein
MPFSPPFLKIIQQEHGLFRRRLLIVSSQSDKLTILF